MAELDVLVSKFDDMNNRCTERMVQLERNLTLTIQSQNQLLSERLARLEETTRIQGKAIDRLKAWKNYQTGALVVLGIVIEQLATRIPWK